MPGISGMNMSQKNIPPQPSALERRGWTVRLAISALLLFIQAPHARAEGPGEPDNAIIEGLLEASRAAGAGRQAVWPGYQLFDQPVLLYRSAPFAVLIGHPHPPADFRAYPVRGFPGSRVFVSTSPLEGINSAYYADYELGGEKVFACLYDAGAGAYRVINTVVHERFHVFQGNLPVDGRKGAFKSFYSGPEMTASDLSAENLALAGLEQAALARALLDGVNDADAVKDFISVRFLRRKLFGMFWAVRENDVERDEGMADYLTARIMEGTRAGGAYSVTALAEFLLRPVYESEPAESMLRGRLYATGHAIGLLLDRRLQGWKARVAGETYPFELLRRLVPMGPGEQTRRIAALKKRFNYAALLVRAEAGLAGDKEARSLAFKDFEAYTGPKLIVRAENVEGTRVSYTAYTTYKLDGDTELFINNPLYEFANGDIELLVSSATLRDQKDPGGRDMLEIQLPSAPKVYSGGKLVQPPESPREFADVSITEANVTLKAKKALVRAAGTTVSVEIP